MLIATIITWIVCTAPAMGEFWTCRGVASREEAELVLQKYAPLALVTMGTDEAMVQKEIELWQGQRAS